MRYAFVSEGEPWQTAKQNCIDMGATLMEIRSQGQYDSAIRLREEHDIWFWIGASRAALGANWLWNSDQEEVNLSEFWKSGGQDTHNHCVAFGG